MHGHRRSSAGAAVAGQGRPGAYFGFCHHGFGELFVEDMAFGDELAILDEVDHVLARGLLGVGKR